MFFYEHLFFISLKDPSFQEAESTLGVCKRPDLNGNLKEGNAILSRRGETEDWRHWGDFATHPSRLQMEWTHGWKLREQQGDTDPEQGSQPSGLGKMAL